MSNAHWVEGFPLLREADDPAVREVLAGARQLHVAAGTTVFRVGEPCRNYLLVLEGCVRVQQVAPNGREIVLYRVRQGESCILTTSCLMGDTHYVAEGVTETDVRVVGIPAAVFQQALEHSPGFRRFVFDDYGRRIAALMRLIEELVFGKVDVRLAKRLLNLAADGGRLELTHQALAAELGSAREVVSRQLKEFERRGWIALARGEIRLLDREALRRLAAM